MFFVTKFERQTHTDAHYDYVQHMVKSCFNAQRAHDYIKQDDPTARLVVLDYLPDDLMYALYGTATTTLYNIKGGCLVNDIHHQNT
jgi:hypothetical protein